MFPRLRPQQISMVRVGSQQAPTVSVPAATTALETGIDINSIMNLMITMMIVVMMMKMMTGAMTGAIGEQKPKLAPVEAS